VRVWQYKKPEFYASHPDAKLPEQRVSHPHNELLFWLVEAGLLAGIGLIILFFGVLTALLKLPFARRYAYMAMLMPIALHTQVELPFYIASLHWFLFLSLLTLVLSPSSKSVSLVISVNAQRLIKIVSIGLLCCLILFFIDTYKASLELKRFESSKQAQVETLNTALNNAYFKQLSTNLVMFSLYQSSLKQGLQSNIKLIAEWTDETIKFDPHPNFFRLAIDANLYLKNHKKACDYAVLGQRLYPGNTPIQQVVENCQNAK
jgi:O-antigen polymerase